MSMKKFKDKKKKRTHRRRHRQIKSPGEALSTFIRASRDPKGETQLRVAKSTKFGILTPKT